MNKEPHVVLYSCSQGCLHVESIVDCIISNLDFLNVGRTPDYILIGIANSAEEANALATAFDAVRHQWPGYEIFTGSDMRPLSEIQKENEE